MPKAWSFIWTRDDSFLFNAIRWCFPILCKLNPSNERTSPDIRQLNKNHTLTFCVAAICSSSRIFFSSISFCIFSLCFSWPAMTLLASSSLLVNSVAYKHDANNSMRFHVYTLCNSRENVLIEKKTVICHIIDIKEQQSKFTHQMVTMTQI